MEQIKVSVVIPVYNTEKYLRECMDSICAQTYENIEIICVDDGSTDSSAEIIKRYQKKDKRIRLIQQTNQYAGIARNNGFDEATGEYVIFLDSDDYFEKSLIEKMVSAIHGRKADIVICQSKGFDERRKEGHELAGALKLDILPGKEVFSKKDIPEHIFQLTAGWAWDKMYRSDFLRDKNIRFQDIKAAEDELFTDLAYGEADAITVVDEVLVTHRTSVDSSLEDRKDQLWRCGYEMLAAEKEELKRRGLYEALEKSFINRAAGYITWNACSITEPACFSEFYLYFQEKAQKEFGFLEYSSEYYDDSFVYQIIRDLGQYGEKEFLCSRIRELNQVVADRDFYIQKFMKCKRWVLPDNAALNGSRVILYGFGNVGKDWYKEIIKNESIKLVMVVDRNYKKLETGSIRIYPLEAIETAEYDYILIAIIEKAVADAVKESLLKRGIVPDKILWFNPTEWILK